jgi:phosphomevalonate kinase
MHHKIEPEIRAIVPGNLLISGEYVILEEGGLGLAMACGPEARGRSWKGKTQWSVIHAITGEGAISLNTATDISDPPFIIKAFRAVESILREQGYEPPVLEIEIDTRDFYQKGRKLGFGSSAAATVILTGLIFAETIPTEELERRIICKAAVKAHRIAQGKKGSGYDILTSCNGAAGMFTGGEHPEWKPIADDHPIHRLRTYSFPGPKEVDSRDAVRRYRGLKEAASERAEDFIKRSQTLAKNLFDSDSEEELIRNINESRLLSAELGDSIGVESWISPPSPFYERAAWKGSGAGNELGLLFLSSSSNSEVPEAYESLTVRRQGLSLFSHEGNAILQ